MFYFSLTQTERRKNVMTWITVDGLDGSGKTHAIQLIKNELENRGYKVVLLRGMGTGKVGEVVREELIHGRIRKIQLLLAIDH